jgi:sugar phosphate isomerase/epimerase
MAPASYSQPHRWTRRHWLLSLVAAGGLARARAAEGAKWPVGVACGWDDVPLAKQAGFEYVAIGVPTLLAPGGDDAAFAKLLERAKGLELPVRAVNGFIPSENKIVGPEVNDARLDAHVRVVCERARRVGVERIVFGSGGARRIPDGWDPARAKDQVAAFGRRAVKIAADQGLVIAIEPLNAKETNCINFLEDCRQVAEAVGHPAFGVNADFYHMSVGGEGPEVIERAGSLVRYCEVAQAAGRAAPLPGGQDFTPYLRALKRAGYTGMVGIECTWTDRTAQFPEAVKELCKQRDGA